MVQILFFGPSTTYGAWDSEGGYVQRLRKYLDKKVIDSNCARLLNGETKISQLANFYQNNLD